MSLDCDESEVARIAREHLRRKTRLLPEHGALLVEAESRQSVRWRFVAEGPSRCSEQQTRIDCHLHGGSGVMWIGEVHVAPRLRGRGVGRRLVAAAEAVAEDLSARFVYVFPLVAARSFWQRLGYRAHRRMARVMVKDLASSDLACGSGGPQ